MIIKKMLDVRGTKIGFMILTILANLGVVLLFFSGVDWLMLRYDEHMTGLDTTMMLGEFLLAALLGFLVTKIANDGRGHTYGIYGGLVGMAVIVILMRSSPLLGVLVGAMALFGNFNGATLAEAQRRAKLKK